MPVCLFQRSVSPLCFRGSLCLTNNQSIVWYKFFSGREYCLKKQSNNPYGFFLLVIYLRLGVNDAIIYYLPVRNYVRKISAKM